MILEQTEKSKENIKKFTQKSTQKNTEKKDTKKDTKKDIKKVEKESEIQKKIIAYLQDRDDVFIFKINNGSVFDPTLKCFRKLTGKGQRKGISDILGLTKNGRFIALEVKTKTGKISKEQKEFLYEIEKRNGIFGVVKSVEDAKKILRNFGFFE